jgi:hypothetical protein
MTSTINFRTALTADTLEHDTIKRDTLDQNTTTGQPRSPTRTAMTRRAWAAS